MKQLTGILFCGLFLPAQVGADGGNVANEQATETVVVQGRRVQPVTEANEYTKKLLDVAGNAGDPLSAIYSLPGVVYGGGDAGGAPAIRGSSPDDNAFFIDGMPVGYIFHVFGDSIFNENLVADFSLLPAAFDSSYGGATGGIVDVTLRDPKQASWEAVTDASLLKAGFLVEGSLAEEQAAFFSYRRSLMQLFLEEDEEFDDDIRIIDVPVSDDYQGKYQWLMSDRQRFTMAVSGASDTGGLSISDESSRGRADPDSVGDLSLDQKFNSQAMTWNYFGDTGTDLSVSLSHLKHEITYLFGDQQFFTLTDNRLIMRSALSIHQLTNHRITVGYDAEHRQFDYTFDIIPYYCTDHQADCEGSKGDRVQGTDDLNVDQSAAYLIDRWQINNQWSTEFGGRWEYNKLTTQRLKHFRAAVGYQLNSAWGFSLKGGSYSRLPNADKVLAAIGNPQLRQPTARHYAVAVQYLVDDDWATSFEVYKKYLDELPRAIPVDEDLTGLRYTNDMSGAAKGVEWVLEKKKTENWYGWFSLSWSRSDRTDEIAQVTVPYYLNTPLIANMVYHHDFNDRWNMGARLTVRSGARYTPIIGIHPNPDYPDHYLPTYGELNDKTLPTFYRLDLQVEYNTSLFGSAATYEFGVINATNHENVTGYYFEPDGNETPDNFQIAKEVGMGAFPYIGMTLVF